MADGWVLDRVRGGHFHYKKVGVSGTITFNQSEPLPIFIIKNCMNVANMTKERYFELLDKV